jgi:hypothetical protein
MPIPLFAVAWWVIGAGVIAVHEALKGSPPAPSATPTPAYQAEPPPRTWSIDQVSPGSVVPALDHTESRVLRANSDKARIRVGDVFTTTWRRSVTLGGELELSASASASFLQKLVKAEIRASLGLDRHTTTEEMVSESKSVEVWVDPGGAVEVTVDWHRQEQTGSVTLVDGDASMSVPFRAVVGLTYDVHLRDLVDDASA